MDYILLKIKVTKMELSHSNSSILISVWNLPFHMSVRAEPLLEQARIFFKETKAPEIQRMLENKEEWSWST